MIALWIYGHRPVAGGFYRISGILLLTQGALMARRLSGWRSFSYVTPSALPHIERASREAAPHEVPLPFGLQYISVQPPFYKFQVLAFVRWNLHRQDRTGAATPRSKAAGRLSN